MKLKSKELLKDRENKILSIKSQQKELDDINNKLLQQLIIESGYAVGDVVYWGNDRIWIKEFILNKDARLEVKTNKVKTDGTKGKNIYNKSFGLPASNLRKG